MIIGNIAGGPQTMSLHRNKYLRQPLWQKPQDMDPDLFYHSLRQSYMARDSPKGQRRNHARGCPQNRPANSRLD